MTAITTGQRTVVPRGKKTTYAAPSNPPPVVQRPPVQNPASIQKPANPIIKRFKGWLEKGG